MDDPGLWSIQLIYFMRDKYLDIDYEARQYRLHGSGFHRPSLAKETDAVEERPLTPHQQWEQLRKELLERIEQIDKATPWAEVEPKWWLHMKEVQRTALANHA